MNKTIIFQELAKGNTCVFINEEAARFFLLQYVKETGKSISRDKGLSYEQFKTLFRERRIGTEVNNQIRSLFVSDFLKNNKLNYFISEKYPESLERLSKYISTLLPQLQRVRSSKVYDVLSLSMKSDIEMLYKGYCTFLDSRDFIEKDYLEYSYEFAKTKDLNTNYSIISSSSMEDLDLIVSTLEDKVNLTFIDSEKIEFSNDIESFKTSVEENRVQCRRIAFLLKNGVNLEDIGITLCDYDNNIEDILVECKKLEIPLSPSINKTISRYPGGKFIKYLKDLYDDSFSLSSMKTFFLERSFPFNDRSFYSFLIRVAIDANINHGNVHQGFDAWEDKLGNIKGEKEIEGKKQQLFEFYKTFKSFVIALNEAESSSQIKSNLDSIMNLIFVETGFSDTVGDRSFGKVISYLNRIEKALNLGNFSNINNLFSLFAESLLQKKYDEEKLSEGIKVYKYPDSASLDLPYHFVLGLTHEDSEIIYSPMKVLPDSIDQSLKGEVNLSSAVLSDYIASSGNLYLSFAVENYKGSQLPPSFFVENTLIHKGKKSVPEIDDPYINELLYWQNRNPNFKANNFQSNTLKQSEKTVLDSPRFNMSGNLLSSYDTNFIRTQLETETKEIPLSSTKIDLFNRCPFAFLVQYGLSVREDSFDYDCLDHLEVGKFLHKVMEIFFKKVKKDTKRFYSGEIEKYENDLRNIFNWQLEEFSYSPKSPSKSSLLYIEDYYIDKVLSILRSECDNFESTISEDFEKNLIVHDSCEVNGEVISYEIKGAVDRVINLGGGDYAIVDYKKGSATIKGKAFAKGIEDKSLHSYQFPCYKRLMEKNGFKVTKAAYFGLKDKKYEIIWENDELLMKAVDDVFNEVIHSIIEKISQGDFRATPSKENCASCSYRQVCRKRYSTKC